MANDDPSIKRLIAVMRDSARGFADIGEHIENTEQRSFFMSESKVRAGYADELEHTVNRVTDADVHETGTAAGAVHRVWGDLKARLGGGDHTLLETAEQGEDIATKAYNNALGDQAVSDTLRALIGQQAEHVRQSHSIIKGFRNATS